MQTAESERIDELVEELYRQRARAWDTARVTAQHFLETIADELLDKLDRDRLSAKTSRLKDPDRAADKIRRKVVSGRAEFPQTLADAEALISDYIGIKVLCKTPRDLRGFVEKLETSCRDPECPVQFAEEPVDYVSDPKDSGYRAYHAVLAVPLVTHQESAPVRVEVQVKTRLQDAWGELTHEDMYKPGEALKPSESHRDYARRMADLLADVDEMADDLSEELDAQIKQTGAGSSEAPSIVARVTRTGPRYALAVGPDGRRGLIPAVSVRDAAGLTERIDVDDYIDVGDRVEVVVDDSENGLFYHPVAVRRIDGATG